jgi:hypothetical protein
MNPNFTPRTIVLFSGRDLLCVQNITQLIYHCGPVVAEENGKYKFVASDHEHPQVF